MSKRIRIFTTEDVAAHNSRASCWVSRNGKVFDVTSFLQDHPGGDDLILQHAGKDVAEAMQDKEEHDHSESAYEMLDEHIIGRLGSEETTVNEGGIFFCPVSSEPSLTLLLDPVQKDWVAADDFHPEDTDVRGDFEKNQFLDLRKPLFRQVWEANFR